MASPEGPALELIGISRTFGSVRALDDVTFVAHTGTVHALLGENGAGKTTLMRIAYGMEQPDAGRVRLFGRDVRAHDVRTANAAGIGMVHQHLSLVPTLTAAENLALGRKGIFRPGEAARELVRLAESSGLRVPAGRLVRDLDIVEQQRLEILKALARGARLLILDEPTSGLAPAEIDDLLRWIREFADKGGTVVLVTHRLREALAVADEVTVLRRGRVVHVAHAPRETSAAELARAIFPDAAEEPVAAAPVATPGDVVAALDRVSLVDARGVVRVRDASLEVRRGEIVGVAAVEGSGQRELLAALAGLHPPIEGEAVLPSRVALIPANRLRDGLIAEFTLVENVGLRGAGQRRGRMPWRAIEERTTQLIDQFSIAAPSPRIPARALSGGNQQRLVVARELAEPVDLVVADDPTRGLDVRASRFVLDRLREAATRGAAVVVHSADLDELLGLATRMVVMFHGRLREVPADRDTVGRAMLGAG